MDGDGEDKGSGDSDGKGDGGVYDNYGDRGSGGGDDATMTRLQRRWMAQRQHNGDNGNGDGNGNNGDSDGRHDGGNSDANRRRGGNSNGVMAT